MPLEPIALVGIGCRYPGASNPDAFWQLLCQGIDAITEVPAARWDVNQFYHADLTQPDRTNTRWGGFLDDIEQFDPQFFGIAPREVNSMDPQQRLLLEVAWEALEDAGQVPDRLRGSKTGVFVGIGTHDYSIKLWQNPVNDPYATTGTGNCIAANRISYVFDFKGPSLAVDTACSSSLVAVHLACQSLWCGESSLALAGGVNVLLLPTVTIGFSKGGFMSSTGRCRSFDASADGYVRSEGAGIVVLKPLSQAIADGDPIYAVIRGSAVNQDGFSNGLAAPNVNAQIAVLRSAYQSAGVSPGQVQYVEAHGTGTKLGDPIELSALGTVLSEQRQPGDSCAIGSVKTNIGHTETAAGVAGLIKVALSLHHQQIPPSLHFTAPNPQIDFANLPLHVQTKLVPWPTRATPALAGVNSFGFGGTNAHVVMAAAPEQSRTQQGKQNGRQQERPLHLLTLSAKSKPALRELAQRYASFLNDRPQLAVADVCSTANTTRSTFQHRLTVITASTAQLQQQLHDFAAGQDVPGLTTCTVTGNRSPQIAFLFTGQGSQAIGMGQQLYDSQPIFRQAIDRCAKILRPSLDRSLLEVLYLRGEIEKENKKRKKERIKENSKENVKENFKENIPDSSTLLDQTAYTQPALFALEYALAQLWLSWGVFPSVVMGHSVGEYVAACIAGVFSLKDGLKLIAARGQLMQSLPANGAMVSVLAAESRVRAVLSAYAEVSIAAINGPQNVVISGKQTTIAKVIAELESQGCKTTRLNVSHAFHSSLMEPVLAKFAKVAAKVKYQVPQMPIVSNVTGKLVTNEIATPDYWTQHIRQPVRFAEGMHTLHSNSSQQQRQIFLEIGAKPTLLSLGRACLPTNNSSEVIWLPSLRPGQSDWQSMLQSLAELYKQGVSINWTGFDQADSRSRSRQFVHLPTYPFQRQRFWWNEVGSSRTKAATRYRSSDVAIEHSRIDSSIHPLLGQRVPLAGSREIRFQVQLAANHPAYLQDHCLRSQPVFPAAAYLEMALMAGKQALNLEPIAIEQMAIEQMTIEQPLLLSSTELRTVQIVLNGKDHGEDQTKYSFEIFSFVADQENSHSATRHALGTIVTDTAHATSRLNLSQLKTELRPFESPIFDYYQQLQQQGLCYGSSFQGITQLWHNKGQALGQIQQPDVISSESTSYYIHPALLDSCFQTVAAALPDNNQRIYLPIGVDTFRLYSRPDDRIYSHVKIREFGNDSTNILKADLELCDETGAIVAQITGLTLQWVSHASLQRLVQEPEHLPNLQDWLYELTWQPKPLHYNPAATQTAQTDWLIFTDRQGLGAKLASELSQQGDRCVLVAAEADTPNNAQEETRKETQARKIQQCYINPDQPSDFQQLITNLVLPDRAGDRSLGVIHLWGLDASNAEELNAGELNAERTNSTELSLNALQKAQFRSCGSVLYLVQALIQAQIHPSRLWLVTKGTQVVSTAPSLLDAHCNSQFNPQFNIRQASLWGLGRVIRLEQPQLQCACLDLDPGLTLNSGSSTDRLTDHLTKQLSMLLDELRGADAEDQIAYRQGDRYVARLLPQTQASAHTDKLQIPDTASFRLGISSYGVLDHLTLIATERRSPQPGEVEIQVCAAGVNFRDVLNALGLLQPYLEQMGFAEATDIPFGGECAGHVVAVGAGVSQFQIGDAVIAAQAIGSLRQFVTVNAQFVVPKPESLGFAEAATLPTTFLTAYYGLQQLAKLKRGDRVLIHAAAGGVGQAAIQLAQSVGAEIYATASPGKWAVLQSLGVERIMNSRTLEFAETIMQLTNGQGVDVILNSLNGEFIAKNLEILAQNGRFVEIGKIGIWDASQVQQVRSDVAYFPFDLLDLSQTHPGLITTMLEALLPQFQQGRLKPLTHTVFPIEAAPTAFRYMAQAKHVGKVVMTLPRPTQQAIVQTDGSYLITGGLGALGLQVAQWLVKQGAKHLLLIGRNPPSPIAQTILHQLQTVGARIEIAQADISDRTAIESVLQSYLPGQTRNSSTPLPPPLKGIIHAAGILDDATLHTLTWEQFDRVMAPKVTGAWNLHSLTKDLPLDFFVCFSSIAALLGSPGQGNYAAANAVTDALMHYRRQLGLPGLSVNWGPWADAGMASRLTDRDQARLTAQGLDPINAEQGLQVLEHLLNQNTTQTGVFPVDWSRFLASSPLNTSSLLNAIAPVASTPAQPSNVLQLDAINPIDQVALLQAHVRMQLAKVMGFSTPDLIDPQENFGELGMDSLMAVELTNRLQQSLSCSIPQTVTFDYPTVAALANYLAAEVLTNVSIDPASVNPAAIATTATEALLLSNGVAPTPSSPDSSSDHSPDRFPNHSLNSSADTAKPAGRNGNDSEIAVPPTELQDIPVEFYQFDRTPEYLNLKQDLERVAELGNPFFVTHTGIARDTTQIDDIELINYASYNYLGMSGDPKVSEAAKQAIDRYGTSVSASRVVSGERPIHRELEQAIASFLGTEDCIVYIGGHATNVSTIGHLFGERDLVLCDALSHNSIRQGCALSGATVFDFLHNDWRSLEQLLMQHRSHYEKVLIAVEGIYSTDGDLAPLPELVDLKQRYKAFLLVDEAHSIGVLGQQGRGIAEHFGIAANAVDLWMGTLSKSFASCGGYIAGCQSLVEYLKYTAPGFVFSVGMSPANAASALAAIRLLQTEPVRVNQLHDRAQLFLTLAREKQLNTGASHDSPVIPIIVGEPYKAVQLSHKLHERGIHVQPMVYPSVPYNAARLRFFVTCTHTPEQIHYTLTTLAEQLQQSSMD